jgi:hypothetical protein
VNITRSLLIAWVIVAMFSASAVAQEPWSWSKLNPFAAKSTQRSSAQRLPAVPKAKSRKALRPSKSSSWFAAPKWPTLSMPKAPDLVTPVKRANQKTKKFLVETANYLSPSKLFPGSAKKTTYIERGNRVKPKRSASKSFFSSLFSPSYERKPARTMTEFVARERPGFGGRR